MHAGIHYDYTHNDNGESENCSPIVKVSLNTKIVTISGKIVPLVNVNSILFISYNLK